MGMFEELRRLVVVMSWRLMCLVKGHQWLEVGERVAVLEIEMAPGEGYPASLWVRMTTSTCPECGSFVTDHHVTGDPAEGWEMQMTAEAKSQAERG